MAAYVIVDVEVTDPEKYQEYIRMVPPSIEAYGGRFLVRGGRAENIEGDWQPRRIVVLQFDSFERAKEWWASEEYRAPKALRQSASVADMIVVEGI
jgi:uncharacterized protein (DUF1330 family)